MERQEIASGFTHLVLKSRTTQRNRQSAPRTSIDLHGNTRKLRPLEQACKPNESYQLTFGGQFQERGSKQFILSKPKESQKGIVGRLNFTVLTQQNHSVGQHIQNNHRAGGVHMGKLLKSHTLC